MNPILRNVLAVFAGFIVGGFLVGIFEALGHLIIPAPEGLDVSDMETYKATSHFLETKHFIPIILAHALGSFFGGLLAAIIGVSRKIQLALIVGALLFAAGVFIAITIPPPLPIMLADLILAYFPMAFLAGKIVVSSTKKAQLKGQ